MKFFTVLIVLFFGALAGTAQFLLKKGIDITVQNLKTNPNASYIFIMFNSLLNPYVIGSLVVYGLAFAVYTIILQNYNVSQIFPMTVGCTFLFTIAFGVMCLGENFGIQKIIGVSLIIAGVYIVSRA